MPLPSLPTQLLIEPFKDSPAMPYRKRPAPLSIIAHGLEEPPMLLLLLLPLLLLLLLLLDIRRQIFKQERTRPPTTIVNQSRSQSHHKP